MFMVELLCVVISMSIHNMKVVVGAVVCWRFSRWRCAGDPAPSLSITILDDRYTRSIQMSFDCVSGNSTSNRSNGIKGSQSSWIGLFHGFGGGGGGGTARKWETAPLAVITPPSLPPSLPLILYTWSLRISLLKSHLARPLVWCSPRWQRALSGWTVACDHNTDSIHHRLLCHTQCTHPGDTKSTNLCLYNLKQTNIIIVIITNGLQSL